MTRGALLREVINTVGRPGRLGQQIRCVDSVSMLAEGWDTNSVAHILGVRAFGTQQVVWRGLRPQSCDHAAGAGAASATRNQLQPGQASSSMSISATGTVSPNSEPGQGAGIPSCHRDRILPLDERVGDAADEAELDDIYETERRLLYVACTRAREHLLLTGVSPVSEYLSDFKS